MDRKPLFYKPVFLLSGWFLLTLAWISACNRDTGHGSEQTTVADTSFSAFMPADSVIGVYYFHFTRMCITCVQLEDTVKSVLAHDFAGETDAGKIVYRAFNLDEKQGKEAARRMQVSGHALLGTGHGKTRDLTNEGFLFIATNPQKVRDLVRDEISGILNDQ